MEPEATESNGWSVNRKVVAASIVTAKTKGKETIGCRAQYCESQRESLEDYLANRDFVSSSQLRRFDRTGLAALRAHQSSVVGDTVMGEAFHSLVLEPQVFSQQYLVLADTQGTQQVESEVEAMQRHWLNAWQWSALSKGRDALLRHQQAPVSQWLASGRKELSIYWRDTENGCWKARPDCFTDDIVLDLKTTSDCRSAPFRRTRERFGYDLQAAHYVDAVSCLTGSEPRFAFLVVELTTPYAVQVHELSANELAVARKRLSALKRSYVAAAGLASNTPG
jgi:PDDEXK-like domain of unknown function (DUF3799)